VARSRLVEPIRDASGEHDVHESEFHQGLQLTLAGARLEQMQRGVSPTSTPTWLSASAAGRFPPSVPHVSYALRRGSTHPVCQEHTLFDARIRQGSLRARAEPRAPNGRRRRASQPRLDHSVTSDDSCRIGEVNSTTASEPTVDGADDIEDQSESEQDRRRQGKALQLSSG
jgi:hypothetical protein